MKYDIESVPDIYGLEAIDKIRLNKKNSRQYIIVLT